MTSFTFLNFKDKCCCCYQDIKEGLQVCSCHLPFCSKHFNMHSQRTMCNLLFYVINKDKLIVESESLSAEEIEKTGQLLTNILKCRNYEEKLIFKENEIECPDILKISLDTKIKLQTFDKLKCEDCDIRKHLYVCFDCGYIGCGRVQYGIEGNGHAQQHFRHKDHSVFVFLNSITKNYMCDTFCYKCDDFVINPFCESKLSCEEFAKPGKTWIDLQKTEIDDFVSVESLFIGIKNAGNTCYISSVLQLIGYIGIKEDLDFESHFNVCENTNPLECLYCQTCRIFNEMKNKKLLRKEIVIDIKDFLKLIWKRLPMFEKNTQHDANEFLMMFLQLIQEAELLMVFPNITQYLRMFIEHTIHCGNCKNTSSSIEEHLTLYTSFESDAQACVNSYFQKSTSSCSCGSEKIITNNLLSLPKYLVLTVGRYKYESNQFVKITKNIVVNKINLERYIKKPILANYFMNELVEKGYTEAELRLALHTKQKFEDVDVVINEYKTSNRTDSKYTISSSILHTGNNMNGGHYMWLVRDNDIFYLVNDKKVTEETAEYLDESYILCFE